MDTIPEPPDFVQAEAATAAELVPSLTESVAKARRALGGFDDAQMGAMWRLQSGGRDIMAMPRVAFVRAIMLNHWYHHRGQLLVYLRLLEPVRAVGVRSDRRRESVRRLSDLDAAAGEPARRRPCRPIRSSASHGTARGAAPRWPSASATPRRWSDTRTSADSS